MYVCYFGIDFANVIYTKIRQKFVLNLYINYLTFIINIVLVMKWEKHLYVLYENIKNAFGLFIKI